MGIEVRLSVLAAVDATGTGLPPAIEVDLG